MRVRSLLVLAILLSASSRADQAPSPSPTPQAPTAPTPAPTPALSPAPTPPPSPEPTPDLAACLVPADEHFSQRSVGAIDLVANPLEIDEAIELYRKALVADPRNMEVLAKLLRALHFRGAYTGLGVEEKKVFFDEGRRLGQAAVDRLEAEAGARRGLSRIEALRLVKGAPALYLWTAVHWGEWGLAKGKFAAARSGMAGRLRDLAQTLIDMDPLFDDAAGYRMLGKLHSDAPKIIFITGWISHEKGLQYLRRAYKVAPDNPVTGAFLAEAILDHEPEKKAEARALLEHCVSLTPRADRVLEDEMYMGDARALLDKLSAAPAR
jgi:tetratricopeptide (TPR) repeat protein